MEGVRLGIAVKRQDEPQRIPAEKAGRKPETFGVSDQRREGGWDSQSASYVRRMAWRPDGN